MEIKKAFNQFKKELAKECGIEGGFTMSGKQINNRTATKLVVGVQDFDWHIEYHKETDKKVQAYDTWTDEEKARSHAHELERIAMWEDLKKKYGTPYNLTVCEMNTIKDSKAFAKLQNEIGKTMLTIETREGCYSIRFNY